MPECLNSPPSVATERGAERGDRAYERLAEPGDTSQGNNTRGGALRHDLHEARGRLLGVLEHMALPPGPLALHRGDDNAWCRDGGMGEGQTWGDLAGHMQLVCPSHPGMAIIGSTSWPNYGMNFRLGPGPYPFQTNWTRIDELPMHGKTLMYTEAGFNNTSLLFNAAPWETYKSSYVGGAYGYGGVYKPGIHQRKYNNIAYIDGHVNTFADIARVNTEPYKLYDGDTGSLFSPGVAANPTW